MFDDGIISIMSAKLNDFDKERIDRGLQKAHELCETHGPLTSSKLAQLDETAILALFEALCAMPYVGDPEARQRYFNSVFTDLQHRKPLKLGPHVLPTMTLFIFDEDQYRHKFAKAAWAACPPESLTADQFEWAVEEHLANAIRHVTLLDESGTTLQASTEQIKLFWEGFLLILNSMSEDVILHCLRAMELQTDVYQLLIHHLAKCSSDEVLLLVLQTISALMQKSSRAFWGALQDLPRAQLAQFVFVNPAFSRLLDRSLEYDRLVVDGDVRVPFLAVWIRNLLQSLQHQHELPGVCQSLTDHLLNPHPNSRPTKEESTARTVAGLYALQTAIQIFSGKTFNLRLSTSVIFINEILNLVAKYTISVINPSAELRMQDRYNVGLSRTALEVIKISLLLDAKTTRSEWTNLVRGNTKIPRTVSRRSDQLWEGFLEIFWPGREGTVDLAKSMLIAVHPLSGVGKFMPPKREVLQVDKQLFNADLEKTAEMIGRMIERLSGFTIFDLELLCKDEQSGMMHTLIASLVHSEDTIRESGTSLIKTITGEIGRSEAIAEMVQGYFQPFLSTFSDVVRLITYDSDSMNPYAPMPHILACSQDLEAALCDTSGVLRSKQLSGIEHEAVISWWTTQWESMQHSFVQLRGWSQEMPKDLLEAFCKRTIELAGSLLDHDGVVASALREHGSEKESLKTVLETPRLNTRGMADLIKLRDVYLLDITVQTLVKLLKRLAEFDLEVDKKTADLIREACKPQNGKPVVFTNLRPSQRAELLKALREDEDIPQIVQVVQKDKPKKQSMLTAWSTSGSATPLSRSGSSTPASTSREIKPTTSKLDAFRSTATKLKAKPSNRLDADSMSFIEKRKKAKAEAAKQKEEARADAMARRNGTVPGEGSGLGAVSGVVGKDHRPQMKSDMMVDSDDESDDDSDDEMVLAGTAKVDPDARKRALELAAKKMGPTKIARAQRTAKDLRARLIPDMDVLHQAILEWDIFHDGNDPPNTADCVEVAPTYSGHLDYKDTFFNLLLSEAWRSFVTAKDEVTNKSFGIKVLNRMSVNKFIEVTTLMPIKEGKDRFLSEGDIVIISQSDDPLNRKELPHCMARIWKTRFKGDSLEVAYRLSSRNNQLLSLLNPGQSFNAIKITNMTTIEREYAALQSLQYYDLLDEVLAAKPSPLLTYGDDAIDQVQKNYALNPGQAKAIMNAKDNDGFTLIQGPPGTGKTKTIVAMVGALLTGHIGAKPPAAVPVARPPITGGSRPANQPAPMKKLLVCAPSNAAVDELVLRLKQGVKTMGGAHHKVNVLRLGRSDAINSSVKDVTLDELVKAAMDGENKSGPGMSERDKLHQEAGEIKLQLNDLRPRIESARASDDRILLNDLQRQNDGLLRRRAQIGSKIDANKDSANSGVRESDVRRKQIQQRILDQAQVLCATLSGSGHTMFKDLTVDFETVIIDEAAQCVELSALIPLKYGCTKCILVGDPKQLPPTVLSQSAARFGYAQSLFVRMQQNHAQHVHLLDTQYRMHPLISEFPSREFYEGRLYDGDDMSRLRLQPWHQSKLLGPYRFFDVEGIQEKGQKGRSLVNTNELEVALQLYQRFRTDYPDVELQGKVGIITPYKAQLYALRDYFSRKYGESIFEQIEFNTTDAFQGRECEIIIFSCVRASPSGGIGFMTDIRRMNVGLTRAKSSLWILGDSRALRQGEFWNKLIDDARSRQLYTNGNVLSMLRKQSEKVAPGSMNDYRKRKLSDVEMTDASAMPAELLSIRNNMPSLNAYAPPLSLGGYNDKGEAFKPVPRGMLPPQIGESTKTDPLRAAEPKKRPLGGADASDRSPKRPVGLPPRPSRTNRLPMIASPIREARYGSRFSSPAGG